MQPQNDQPQNGEPQRMTKRQRRELKRQEKYSASAQSARRQKLGIWIWWVIAIILVGASVTWLVTRNSSSSPKTPDALTTMKQDTHDPYLGNKDAAVVVREFSDFQCPACLAALPTVRTIEQTYGDKIKLEFNDYPLVSIHQNALFAAEAAKCAQDQGKFWDFHDKLYATQSDWEGLDKAAATVQFKQYASDLSLDTATFNTCIDTNAKRSVVQEDINQGNALRVDGTPTFFVNDTKVSGSPTVSNLSSFIDAELAKTATVTNSNTNQ